MKRSPLRRRTALRRGTPLRRTEWRRKPGRPTVPPETRVAVFERAQGLCEVNVRYGDVCVDVASDVHHRVPRGLGGCHGEAREVSDRLSSVMAACRPCHSWVHERPEAAATNGWLVRRGVDASAVPVWVRGGLSWLDDAGRVHDFEAGAA